MIKTKKDRYKMKRIRAQVDRLKEVYPGKHINISLNTGYYTGDSGDVYEWKVYVADAIHVFFKTFRQVVAFIDDEVKI